MGVNTWKNRHGRERYVVSKTWPDGKRTRKIVETKVLGNQLLREIEKSIALGIWREKRKELFPSKKKELLDPTLAEFAEIYLEEYCKTKNRRPDFKEQALKPILSVLGQVHIKELTKSHAYEFLAARSKQAAPATVNRGLAVLKNLMSFAVEKDLVTHNPLFGFRLLPEPEKSLRILTVEEYKSLLSHVYEADAAIGVFTETLGETALRKSEGLRLQWPDINIKDRLLTVGESKSGRRRHVPLSRAALEALSRLERVVGIPWLFMRTRADRWKDPRGPFHIGRKAAGLEWAGFHDLRHFRATQWIRAGIDVRTVQGLLGHSSITTTQIYAHSAPISHVRADIDRVAELEASSKHNLPETEKDQKS